MLTLTALKCVYVNQETKGLCSIVIINVLVNASFESYMYVIGLQPLIIFYSFCAGIDFRRQNLTSKVVPRTERVNVYPVCWNNNGTTITGGDITNDHVNFDITYI